MANIVDKTSWYSKIVELSILPFNLHYIIRLISGFFVRRDTQGLPMTSKLTRLRR